MEQFVSAGPELELLRVSGREFGPGPQGHSVLSVFKG